MNHYGRAYRVVMGLVMGLDVPGLVAYCAWLEGLANSAEGSRQVALRKVMWILRARLAQLGVLKLEGGWVL